MKVLFEAASHKNLVFGDLSEGSMVQANQHLIVCNGEGMLLDPGGHKVYTKLIAAMSNHLPPSKLRHILFSHQDPDILAAANGWLMMTDANAYLSALWMRFIPHFGVDDLVIKRVQPIPDKGMTLSVGGVELKIIPAHFMHSCGNFQVYDPVAKILYSGDLGASIGNSYDVVTDFAAHVQYIEGFHVRYMPSSKALKSWAAMARKLDIQTIAPQHGAAFVGPDMVKRFVDWIDGLNCGVDVLDCNCVVP